tara:strand:+ start:193 stop:543 length:351 start_codon:yes stop_codon:yes gene_type:complete
MESFNFASMFLGHPRQREAGMRALTARLKGTGLSASGWYSVVWERSTTSLKIVPADEVNGDACVRPTADIVDMLLEEERPRYFQLCGDKRTRAGTTGNVARVPERGAKKRSYSLNW